MKEEKTWKTNWISRGIYS